jgi:hypothetical protein
MGVFFPIHPPEDVNKLDRQKRSELKAEIMKVLLSDPDVEAMLKEKLPDLKKLLQEKTRPVLERLSRT